MIISVSHPKQHHRVLLGYVRKDILPDLFLSLLDQVHQSLVKVFLVLVVPGMLFVSSLHILFVRGAGNVAGVISQAHHLHLTHSARVSAVPRKGRRERAFNRSFGHGADLVWFGSVFLPAELATTHSGSAFCYLIVKISSG